jgi:hypothetical protein
VSPDAAIVIELRDASTHVNTNTLQLKCDQVPVNGLVTQSAGVTSINYDPPGLMQPGSTHVVELSYTDDAAPPKTNTVSYSFTVYPYLRLPATYAVSADTVNYEFAWI